MLTGSISPNGTLALSGARMDSNSVPGVKSVKDVNRTELTMSGVVWVGYPPR